MSSVAAVASVIWSHVAAGRFVPPAVLKTHGTLSTLRIFSQLRSVRPGRQLRGAEPKPER